MHLRRPCWMIIFLVEVQLFYVNIYQKQQKGGDWIYLLDPWKLIAKGIGQNAGKGRRASVLLGLYRPGFAFAVIVSRDITLGWLWFSLMSKSQKDKCAGFHWKRKGRLECNLWWNLICVLLMGLNFYNYYFHFHGSFPETIVNQKWWIADRLFGLPSYSAFVSTKLCQANGSICAPG